jgi:hypothetical protein
LTKPPRCAPQICQPMDAMEELHVAMARAELHEES